MGWGVRVEEMMRCKGERGIPTGATTKWTFELCDGTNEEGPCAAVIINQSREIYKHFRPKYVLITYFFQTEDVRQALFDTSGNQPLSPSSNIIKVKYDGIAMPTSKSTIQV